MIKFIKKYRITTLDPSKYNFFKYRLEERDLLFFWTPIMSAETIEECEQEVEERENPIKFKKKIMKFL